ncbi:MAG: hypothetical protein QOE23_1801, partial [Pseudonocardiales bacterium]|nr:hypothetical protein [Pseudonocardiales bacterium]
GFGWSDSYGMTLTPDGTGTVTISQENGAQVSFQPNGSGGFNAAPRVLASLIANPDGTYTFTRKPDQQSFTFSSSGQLISESDRNGYLTSLQYSGAQLTSVTDPAGRKLAFAYAGTHIASVTDPLGRKTTYTYDAAGNLISTTDAAGQMWKYSYDASHLLLSMTDPRGGATTNAFDGANRVTAQTDPRGSVTRWSYVGNPVSPGGGTTSVTDPNGNITTYDYANLELQDVTHATGTPLAATTRYTYDPATLGLSSVTDPNGNVTTSTYDSDGNQTATTDALGRTTTFTYDQLDDLTSKTLPSGQITAYSYDSVGNLTMVTDAVGNHTDFSYGDPTHPGDVTEITDRDGRATTMAYDVQGDITATSVSPSAGVTNTTASVYDAVGQRLCQASPKATTAHVSCPAAGGSRVANTTTTTYDQAGRVTALTDPLGHTTATSYDLAGNRTQVTDASGHTTKYSYNANNQAVSITRADGSTVSYAYDPNGNQTSQTDAAGNATHYSYDALNRQVAVTDPLGHITRSSYDLAGNRTGTTDPSGRTTTYRYDAANQLSDITYSDTITPAVNYAYTSDGQRSSMTDGTGTTTYAYDGLDRLIGQTNGAGATVAYAYNNSGQVTGLTYPSGQTVAKTYDGASQLTSLTDWLGKTFNFGYDPNGNTTSQADPNGVTASSTYNDADQLTAMIDKTATATLASFSYTRNSLGQLASATTTGVPGSPETYGYSALNQLSSVNASPYGYDHADNLIKLADGTTQTFNAANQLTTSTTPVPAPPAPVVFGRNVVAADQQTGSTLVSSPVLQTTLPNELLVAFVSAGGPTAHAQRVTAVTGAGLRWTLAARSNGVLGGTTEIWQAYAPKPIASRVTASLLYKGYHGSITVMSFTGSVLTTSGATAAHGRNATPAIAIRSSLAGSVVLAVGQDLDHPAAVTPALNQVLVHQFRDARTHQTNWTQRVATRTALGGIVRVSDKLSAIDRWQMAAVEIHPAPQSAATVSKSTYGYDSQGNRTRTTKDAVTVATKYDQASRLVAYSSTATYAYDGDGLRASKTVNGVKTAFAWDQSGSLPLLLTDGSDAYVYGPDGLPLEKISSSTPTYLLHDQQGSTRLLTNATAAVVGTYAYSPYGKTIAHGGSASTPLQYDGQYTDWESGYQYLRARYYDPTSGQFISRDPLVDATHVNYGFAGDSPFNEVDPSGMISIACALLGLDPWTSSAGDFAEALIRRASVLGMLLRTGDSPAVRSAAAALLRDAGRLASNPILQNLSRYAPAASAVFGFTGAVLSGDSVERASLTTAGSVSGGAGGAALGGVACGAETVATLGFGAVACPVLIVGGGAVGGWVGNKFGGWVSDVFGW